MEEYNNNNNKTPFNTPNTVSEVDMKAGCSTPVVSCKMKKSPTEEELIKAVEEVFSDTSSTCSQSSDNKNTAEGSYKLKFKSSLGNLATYNVTKGSNLDRFLKQPSVEKERTF